MKNIVVAVLFLSSSYACAMDDIPVVNHYTVYLQHDITVRQLGAIEDKLDDLGCGIPFENLFAVGKQEGMTIRKYLVVRTNRSLEEIRREIAEYAGFHYIESSAPKKEKKSGKKSVKRSKRTLAEMFQEILDSPKNDEQIAPGNDNDDINSATTEELDDSIFR